MLIRLNQDTVTPELRRILGEVKRPLPLYQAGAKAVQVELTRHLRKLQARGNAKGWPSQHFFARGPNSVERHVGIARLDASGAEITIADPRFVHRITGGVVTPKRRQFLAIPLRAEAYALSGKGSLRQAMPGLKVWKFKRGLYLVREETESRGKGALHRIRVILLFKLVRSVRHRPHPEELPDSRPLGAAARRAMLTAARLLLRAEP